MTDRKIVIYGAGDYGKRMLQLIRSLGGEVDLFCQTEVDEGAQVEGVPVVSFATLSKIKERMQIFIAIANKNVSRKIRLRLASVFFDRAEIRDCARWLDKKYLKDDCPRGGYCVLCGTPIEAFLAGGVVGVEGMALFRLHHIIGGGHRDAFQCPVCGGIDRERWQLWVLSKHTSIFREKCRVLHFAPEPHISEFIAANPDCEYYTGDIVPGRAMHQTDILDIQYKDNTFDYIIMNHVLEHIEDMDRAMSEVKRVMNPKGRLILSFPVCTDMDTLDLPGPLTPKERLENYGQEDHVRLFGRDYLQRICSFGFEVEVFTPREQLTADEVRRYGFIEDDVLMVCRK